MPLPDSKSWLTANELYLKKVEQLLRANQEGSISTPRDSSFETYTGKLHTTEDDKVEDLPLSKLRQIFRLSPLEIDIIVLCFAAAFNSKYSGLFATLNGHPDKNYVTSEAIKLLLKVADECDDLLERSVAVGGHLRSWQILSSRNLKTHGAIYSFSEPLFLTERMMSFIKGSKALDLYSRRYMRDPDQRKSIAFEPSVRERSLLFSQQNRSAEQTEMVYISGPDGAGHEAAGILIAEDCSEGMIVFKTEEFLQLKPDWARRVLKAAVRDSMLLNRCLYIPETESILSSPLTEVLRGVLGEVFQEEIRMPPIIFSGEGSIDSKIISDSGNIFLIELAVPSESRRVEIWRESLRDADQLEEDITIEELAARYKFTPGQIQTAINFARHEKIARGASTGLNKSDLVTGCRRSSNRKLTDLADRIDARFTWDDLVLSPNLTDQVKGVVRSYRQIGAFFEGWDFGDRFKYGKGVSALFGGASGTGKTMAASVIAADLDLELYKIDLSRVISKYIGETEKNLARIFREAATSNAILFFDEADALFGKRTEVKDAHDRHANIEIDYLLQQMEAYEGLTILATNLSQNIDDAFTRRLQFIINFTKPKVAERERIWRGMFPEKAPVHEDVDFGLLAQNVELAGGGIKNIIFSAGMMALDEGSSISMRHLVRGVKIEYLKENKPFIAANFGPHGQS